MEVIQLNQGMLLRNFWKNTGWWSYLRVCKFASFIDCGIFVSKKVKNEDFHVFGVLCWGVWLELCKKKHDTKPESEISDITIAWCFPWLEMFKKSKIDHIPLEPAPSTSLFSMWRPPPANQLRLDVDARVDFLRHWCSVGAVIRDSRGKVLGAMNSVLGLHGSVKSTELLAIRTGMNFCLLQRFMNVGLYFDSLQAVRTVNGVIAMEISTILRNPAFLFIKHMNRTSNCMAHCLAHKALRDLSSTSWYGDFIPTWLVKVVSHDILTS